jgi:hypothetical protein
MIFQVQADFQNISFDLQSHQKDYDFKEIQNVLIFIFGYPVDFSKNQWASPDSIYKEYCQNRWDFMDAMDGAFSILIVDKNRKKTHIITDPVGIYTLFYYQDKQQLVISDRILEIKKRVKNVQLNSASILEYLNLCFKIGRKTHFINIYEFEPARIYSISEDFEMAEKNYWNLFEKKSDEKIGKEKFRELFNTKLQAVTNLEQNIIMPMSGGRDTRTILSAILKEKEKLHCYTFGPDYHSDLAEARNICDYFGLDHRIVDLNDDWARNIDFDRELEQMNINGIGPHFYNMQIKYALDTEKHTNGLAIQGELGNQTWRHHPFGNLTPSSMDIKENAHFMLKNLTRVLFFKSDQTGFYQHLYKAHTIDEIKKTIELSIEEDLSKLPNPEIPSDFSEFFIFRTICYNFYSNILKFIGRYSKLYLPFLQKDLLQNLHLLQINTRVSAEYQKYIIAQNNQYLATKPYRNTGRKMKYVKLIGNKVANNIIRYKPFNHPELHNYPRWISEFHEDYFRSILNYDNMALSGLFNRKELEGLIDRFLGDQYSVLGKNQILFKFSNQHFIYNLFSLEQWLQKTVKYCP